MASQATVQASAGIIHEGDGDECRENIPPGNVSATGTLKPKVQDGDMVECSSTQPTGETKPLSDSCHFATPAPYTGVKAKSRISNLQTALTPIFKYLNFGVKCQNSLSPEPLEHGKNPDLNVSSLYHELTEGWHKALESVVPFSPTECSFGPSASASSHRHPHLILEEITQLDDTVDFTMPLTSPSVSSPHVASETPVSLRERVTKSEKVTDTDPDLEMGSSLTVKSEMSSILTPRGADITTNDSSCFKASLEVTRDIVDTLKNSRLSFKPDEQNLAGISGSIMIQSSAVGFSDTLPGNAAQNISSPHDKSDQCMGKSITMNDSSCLRPSLDVTQDISAVDGMKNNQPSLEFSKQNMTDIAESVMSRSSVEGSSSSLPGNVTRDISSSSDKSTQCTVSLSSIDMECDSNSKNCTSEVPVKPLESSNPGQSSNTSRDVAVTSKVPQPSLGTAMNSTFTRSSSPTNIDTTVQMSCPQNNTLGLPPSNPTTESVAEDQNSSVSQNTFETCPVMNHNSSARETSGSCVVQNNTFNVPSLKKSNDNTSSEEACPQNKTLDIKPLSKPSGEIDSSETNSRVSLQNTLDMPSPPLSKPSGEIDSSETNSHVSLQNTLDMPSPPKPSNPTISSKNSTFEAHSPGLSKPNGTTAGAEANTIRADVCDSTFEANPVVAVVSGAEGAETKEPSQSGLPIADGLSDSLGHQSMDMEREKGDTFNLDDSLDLKADPLVTSTPMPDFKMFNLAAERTAGKSSEVQKRLYRDGPSKPAPQIAAPSNIISDRKTFLTVPAARSLLPPLRAAPQLLKFKPVSTIPARSEPPTSDPPMTRQRAQAEASRNTGASDVCPKETTGTSSSCIGRPAATGSKLPSTGLRRPQASAIPSATQRVIPSLRPPSTRSQAAASSNVDKTQHGPTATNPTVKTAQAPSQMKKHLLTRREPLPVAKKKKMDPPLPSSGAEATSSCNPASKAQNLKVPATSQRAPLAKTENQGCARCGKLEQQLKEQSEEIKRLKEELLKHKGHKL